MLWDFSPLTQEIASWEMAFALTSSGTTWTGTLCGLAMVVLVEIKNLRNFLTHAKQGLILTD